ncbi:hypothetical protein [Chelatococcus reniformis]|uniref:J domain-containing protein n=1 Tax=Chelatococcus reniformis TaxID=1494448 RepID=A0A916UKR2_9HYPH|nr:hypothetical protein [Chelatococcus reniformis]GGC75857.1 hypothetical protein GCM10010994_37840 [Chelatococcus reniformis]
MSNWAILGLEPTGDTTAIRRAYARKLKAMDVDADPKGFMALRSALDLAVRQASEPEPQPIELTPGPAAALDSSPATDEIAEFWPSTAGELVSPVAERRPPASEPAVPFPPARTPKPVDDHEARFDRLAALLFVDDETAPPDRCALQEALRALLDHPDMEAIDLSARTEARLAEAIFHAVPRSDAILPLVVERFGWAPESRAIHARPLIVHLARRADDLAVLDQLSEPLHRWHAAFRLLQRPPPRRIGLRAWLGDAPQVAQLLADIRAHNPDLISALDTRHVALWDARLGARAEQVAKRSTSISWYGYLIGGWIALYAAHLTMSLSR